MKEVCKNCLLYNNGWCEAFVVQKPPNTKGCFFSFVPNEQKGENDVRPQQIQELDD